MGVVRLVPARRLRDALGQRRANAEAGVQPVHRARAEVRGGIGVQTAIDRAAGRGQNYVAERNDVDQLVSLMRVWLYGDRD